MPALRQQKRRAALVPLFRHHIEKERLTKSPLASQEVRVAYYKLLIQIRCDWDPERTLSMSRHVDRDSPCSVASPGARCGTFDRDTVRRSKLRRNAQSRILIV